MTCHASGEPIPEGAAYITDKDGNSYLPEYYPDAQTGETAEPLPEPEGILAEPEPAPAKKAGK